MFGSKLGDGMIRCLCCNKEILTPAEYEKASLWHAKCIRSFFGTERIPELDLSDKELKKLADQTVKAGLTIPGVQKKLSLHLSKEDRVGRFTIVGYPSGYILKPQSDDYPNLPEAEFLSMKMADKTGISTVPNALILVNGRYAFITKRIDRKDGQLFAMEDFCQLSGRVTSDKYRSSYENCGKIIRRYSNNTGIDIAEFYYRLLFCFLTGNSDMHLKNFSLIEDSPGNRVFALSKAYDMLPVNVIMPSDPEQMALTVNGKKRNIRKKDFTALADNLGLAPKAASGLMSKMFSFAVQFDDIIDASYVPENMKSELKELIKERAAVFE